MMFSFIAVAIAGLTGTYVLLWTVLHFTQDEREPIMIENNIPFLSPVFGMIMKGSKYHAYLRSVS